MGYGDDMPVIKGRGDKESSRSSRASRPSNKQARSILAQAKESAVHIVEEAHRHAAEFVQEAHQSGQQEGFAQAEHMREQIKGLEHRMFNEVEAEAVRTALSIAEKLIEAELEAKAEAVVDIAVAALAAASDAREVFLRVNPKNAGALRHKKQRLLDALSVARSVDIRVDKNVPPGGVLIQTESGVIDATLETQLQELGRILGA